ncbi:transmembrane protein 179-like [Uloborus diversus]|uniref:transmembrane protein 179-like n=1 Tax=Uloborus diversus TaxID=327109 RepID=UPI00240A2E54|nr:transmembrane protein 179-like [Uloborus diversus]
MAVSNVLLLFQATGYVVALIFSLCTVVPLILNLQCFKGHCLLFTTGTFGDDANMIPSWASKGYCIYTLIVGAFLSLVSLVQAIRMFSMLRKEQDSSFLSAFIDCILTLALSINVFAVSILVTVGFKTWCESLYQRVTSCDDASVMEFINSDGITTIGFYIHIQTVQFGIWSSWVCCVLLTVLSTLKLCRYHEQEVIRVSMARQRQKIINQCDKEYTD